jgi:hypothetical protein
LKAKKRTEGKEEGMKEGGEKQERGYVHSLIINEKAK